MDVLKLLKDDHRKVEELFSKLESTSASRAKSLVAQLRRELELHGRVESEIVYPAIRDSMEELAEILLEAHEEHEVVDRILDDLAETDPGDERFHAKLAVLMNLVRQHVAWEEKELFPEVRSAMEIAVRRELGEEVERAKKGRGREARGEERATMH